MENNINSSGDWERASKSKRPRHRHIGLHHPKTVYWVLGKDGGRRVIMGSYPNEEVAEADAFKNFQHYEVIPLRTIDRAEASREIRKRVLDETHNIEDTFQRFRHKYHAEDDYR